MTFAEAGKEIEKYRHFLHHTFSDTITQVLMDLYINFQDSADEDSDDRKKIKAEIISIVNSFKTRKKENSENWIVVSNPKRYIDEEVFNVLNYILDPNSQKPKNIPDIFLKRIADTGREYSLNDFYLYR